MNTNKEVGYNKNGSKDVNDTLFGYYILYYCIYIYCLVY